jgi:hypothetical protein
VPLSTLNLFCRPCLHFYSTHQTGCLKPGACGSVVG